MNVSASGEESPFWAWLAHHQMPIIFGAIGLGTLGVVIDEPLSRAVAAGLMVMFMCSQSAVIRHTGILCGRCLERVPTNAAVLVKRRDWALRLYHWQGRRALLILGLIIAAVVVDWFVAPSGISWLSFTVWPWFALSAATIRFHNRVAPWCPHCKGWDDGDHAHAPDPMPTGTKKGR